MVSQETAADASISFWYSEELCDQIQHINKHFARKRQSQANEILSERSFCPLVGGSSHNSPSTYCMWMGPLKQHIPNNEYKPLICQTGQKRSWACFCLVGQVAPPVGRGHNKHWGVWALYADDTGQSTEMCLQLRQWLSAVRAMRIFQTHPAFLLLSFLKSCSVSRSSSKYASAIIELSDLIIERRQRILHHWDWIYWRTQQGKRFKRALSIVHKYTFLKNIFTKLISSCRKIIAWQLQVYQGCGAEAIGPDWPKRCGRIGGT